MALIEDDYPGVVRRSQESLELAVKAVLRLMAVEYPREHDVGEALSVTEERLPENLRSAIPNLRRLLTELAERRGPAFYGYEREGTPPSRAFTADYAKAVFEEVKALTSICLNFIEAQTGRRSERAASP